jgi:curved DNA-binding protein CbpA
VTAPGPGEGRQAAASGSFRQVSLPAFLFALFKRDATGELHVRHGIHTDVVHFRDGFPVAMKNDVPTVDVLGQIVHELGYITAEQRNDSLQLLARSGGRHGETLVQMGLLTRAQLLYALHVQLRRKLNRLFYIEDGGFNWFFGDHGIPAEFHVHPCQVIWLGLKTAWGPDRLGAVEERLRGKIVKVRGGFAPYEPLYDFDEDELSCARELADGWRSFDDFVALNALGELRTLALVHALELTEVLGVAEPGSEPVESMLPRLPAEPGVRPRAGEPRPGAGPGGDDGGAGDAPGWSPRGGAAPRPVAPPTAAARPGVALPRQAAGPEPAAPRATAGRTPTPVPAPRPTPAPAPRATTAPAPRATPVPAPRPTPVSAPRTAPVPAAAAGAAGASAIASTAVAYRHEALRLQLQEKLDRLVDADHFEALEIEPTATRAQVQEAFRALAKLYRPDALPSDADGLHAPAEAIWDRLVAAHAVLDDDRQRYAYATLLRQGGPADSLMARQQMMAQQAFDKGEAALRGGALEEAEREFAEAVRRNPQEPEYRAAEAWARFRAAGGSQAAPKLLRDEAFAAVERALQTRDRSERLLLWSAELYEADGRLPDAVALYRKLVEINPGHVEARRRLDRHQHGRGPGGKDDGKKGLFGGLFKGKK